MTDKIEEIRARHLREDRWCYSPSPQMHTDRATLLAEVERLNKDLLAQNGCCDGAAAQDAHVRREREKHRAEVERLRTEIDGLRAQLEERYILMRVRQLEHALDAERKTTRRLRAALEGKP